MRVGPAPLAIARGPDAVPGLGRWPGAVGDEPVHGVADVAIRTPRPPRGDARFVHDMTMPPDGSPAARRLAALAPTPASARVLAAPHPAGNRPVRSAA